MVSVAYDVTSLAQNRFGGIAQVCHHTLEQAAHSQAVDPFAIYRRGDPSNISVMNMPRLPVSWLDHLSQRKYDIVHALGHRIPPARYRRLVYTLYDAWSLYPNRYQSRDFQKKVGKRMLAELKQADAVVSISQATHAKLLELEILDPQRCHVVRCGVSAPVVPPGESLQPEIETLSRQKYVLFVGRIEVRKNLEHVVEAVRSLDNLHLVIVGQPGYGGEELERNTLGAFPSGRLHRFEKLDPVGLDHLYRNALVLLLPSWEEGFGLPILEAMVRGCPVITSNCSASAEIAGPGAILVDPAQPNQSHDALLKLIDDEKYRQKMIAAGRTRAAEFSWVKYFAELEEVYQQFTR